MTQEDITFFRYPDEWEAYVITWNDETNFLNETGTEITEEEFQNHDYMIKIWTKEMFKKEMTELNTGGNEKLTEIYPVYKARQLQLVEMKMEDYLKRQVTFEEGKLAVIVFLGEEISNDDNALYKFQTELKEFMQNQRDIHSYSFSLGRGSKRDVQFLEIDDYPAFFVFDHEKLIYKTYEQDEFIEFIENY
ncbi:hypothetical protein H1D32_08350 [Anaerobacillus sp. CMMVII]|uniref:hypothetical protein n=1 Tax=Anaerobacillus sp. CMMVII TaxID=2755588 RepID=UPI0021B7FA1B|nr:hypothetical protein [Anaerobacillus sp. CMMVII]MCT8137766.1 hypothetical protein [Anaerobacillus sp. CMMVII]